MKELADRTAGRKQSPPQDLDRHVGERIRQQRILLGWNQIQLAGRVGITCQQANKYEKGVNRITAGRLYTIAEALGVDVDFFFEGLLGEQNVAPTPQQRIVLDFVHKFTFITKKTHREALSDLVRALAQ